RQAGAGALPCARGDPVHARRRRRAVAAERARDLHVDRADAECGEPDADHVRARARDARRSGAGVLRDRGGRGRSRRRPGDHRVDVQAETDGVGGRSKDAQVVNGFSSVFHAAWLIPTFPLAGFVMLIFFGKRWKEASGPVAVLMMLSSFVYGLVTFASLVQIPETSNRTPYGPGVSIFLGARDYT